MNRKLLEAVILGAMLAAAGGCNTVEGIGEDIQSVGRAGERAID